MADVKKFSLIEKLRDADDTLMGSPSVLGMTSLTYPNYINSMRSTMFTSHLKQFLNLTNPDFPFVFTNVENVVGKYSSGYYMAPNNFKIYRKVIKYDDIPENPTVHIPNFYLLFVFNEETKTFDVVERAVCESLTENFGYEYKNEVIDNYEEGDTIPEGTVLYKSSSYDEDMNYGYGKNVTMAYTLDPYTSEDAAVVSRSLCKMMTSIETETIKICLNSNDFLINTFGDKDHYKPFPEIGEKVDNILAVSRRLFNNQLLFDFKDSNLREMLEGDNIYYIAKNEEVIDYTIFSNSEDDHNNPFYEQVNKYLKSQRRYYQDVLDTIQNIIDSGYEYSRKIDYLYKRAQEFLDKDKHWKDGDSEFNNMEIEITVMRHVPLAKGCKLVGRMGNKSVVSQIREDEDMPYTKDGRRVDLLFNVLAIINRTTAFVLFETFINGASYQVRQKMKEMSFVERENTLFDFIRIFNEDQADKFYKDYKKLKKKEKEEYILDAIENGIYIHQIPMWETLPIFYRCLNLRKRFPFIGYDDLYIKKWGRERKILTKYFIGEMYILELMRLISVMILENSVNCWKLLRA